MTQKECVEHIQGIIENSLKERGITDWNFYEISRIYRVLDHTIIKLEIVENEFIKIQFKIILKEDELKVFVPQLQYTQKLDEWVTHAINKNMDLVVKTEEEYPNFILYWTSLY